MSIFQPSNPAITFKYSFTGALSFRAKLLLAMMLVVLAVTTATVYLAEKNRRANQQQVLDAQFQSRVQSFLKIQEAQSDIITEKCFAISHAVRLRAALEERDIDDLYQNALTELEGMLDLPGTSTETAPDLTRASFFRFLDADGLVLPPERHPAGLTDLPSLDESLSSLGKMLRPEDDQAVGFIALARGNRPTALRKVVLSQIRDPAGRSLGALVVGFPINHFEDTENDRAIKSGIWLKQQLYIESLDAADRHLVAEQVRVASSKEAAGRFPIELESGSHLLYYKALDPETHFAPAYQVCLYPLAASIREEAALRWKIIAFGFVVLSFGFAASLFVAKGLSKPVEKIVAGSVENLTRRKQAEEDLVATNRELEKALNELKATQQQVIQQERLSAIGQMASGIAHDFNNNLTPILGFAELLLENDKLLDNKTEARRCLEMLRTSAKDAASVVSRLREFYRPAETDEEFPVVDLANAWNSVGADYFATVGLPVTRGRAFNQAETTQSGGPMVAIIDEVLAKKLWPEGDALGQRIQYASDNAPKTKNDSRSVGMTGDLSGETGKETIEIVGIVPNTKQGLFEKEPHGQIYLPFARGFQSNVSFFIRFRSLAAGSEASTADLLRRTVREVDPALPVLTLKSFSQHLDSNFQLWIVRAGAAMFSVFGGLALGLAVVGLYGVKAYSVARRTREIGIRMALGAQPGTVLRMIMREGSIMLLSGIVLGLLLAAGTAKILSGLLYEVGALDPVAFTFAPLTLAIAALFATWLPARRATRISPMAALRME